MTGISSLREVFLEILVANEYYLPTHSPFVLVKDSVCISPSFVSESLSIVFSGCKTGFPTGNSKVPAKSCSVHHLRLVCSYARQNISLVFLPSSCHFLFLFLFSFDFSVYFCFVGFLFGFVLIWFFLKYKSLLPFCFS